MNAEDPKSIAALRAEVERHADAPRAMLSFEAITMRELLAAYDDARQRAEACSFSPSVTFEHAEGQRQEIVRLRAEVTRLRARVRVEAGDVERAGVTRAKVESWVENGRTAVWGREAPRGRIAVHGDHQGQVADAVQAIAYHCERPSL